MSEEEPERPFVDADFLARELVTFFKTVPQLHSGQFADISEELCETYGKSYGKTEAMFKNLNTQLLQAWGSDLSHLAQQQQQQQQHEVVSGNAPDSSSSPSSHDPLLNHPLRPPS